ncbi:hypothetical protein V8E36_007565 [Tilletia maclaganii]
MTLGPIVDEFFAAKMDLTILVRLESASKPELQSFQAHGAKVVMVDFDSIDSIAEALRNIDAFISVLGNSHKVTLPDDLARAAKRAGVKVFVPSAWGLNYLNPRTGPLPSLLMDKVKHHHYLSDLGLPWLCFTVNVCGAGNVAGTVTDVRDIAHFVRLILTMQPIPAAGQGRVYRVEGYARASGHKWSINRTGIEELKPLQTIDTFEGYFAWMNVTLAEGRQKLEDPIHNDLVGFRPEYTLDDAARAAITKWKDGTT